MTMTLHDPRLPDRFWAKVSVSDDGCWRWTGYLNPGGYGSFDRKRVHRVSYEALVGPIPPGLVIDHLCRVRNCVNPEHLEPVTGAENTRRGEGGRHLIEMQLAKTHCPQGHPYTAENTIVRAGDWRRCRRCQRIHQQTADRKRGRAPLQAAALGEPKGIRR